MTQAEENRRNKIRLKKILRIKYNSSGELLEEYTQNISQGGMFIAMREPLEMNSLVEVYIQADELFKEIHVEGRVVHRLPRETAREMKMKPGVGIQFTRFFGEDQSVLANYVSRLRDTQNHI